MAPPCACVVWKQACIHWSRPADAPAVSTGNMVTAPFPVVGELLKILIVIVGTVFVSVQGATVCAAQSGAHAKRARQQSVAKIDVRESLTGDPSF